MRALQQHDDELASVSTEAEEPQRLPWKTVAITVCATLAVGGCSLIAKTSKGEQGIQDRLLEEAKCSPKWNGCMQSGCCADEGYVCCTKGPYWAGCQKKEDCKPGWKDGHSPEEWVGEIYKLPTEKNCGSDTADCRESGCCQSPGYTCFAKNDHWANCNASCTQGIWEADHPDHKTEWGCQIFDLPSHPECTFADATGGPTNAELKECCKKTACDADAVKALKIDEETCVQSKCSAYDDAPPGTTASGATAAGTTAAGATVAGTTVAGTTAAGTTPAAFAPS